MKKLLLITAFIVSASAMNYSQAQIRFNVGINLGIPGWIPGGYAQADYYYLPEIDAYYNVPQRRFVYFDGYNWVFAASLPSMYADFDLYNCHRLPVYESRPYLHADIYRERYAQFRTGYAYRQPSYRQQVVVENRYPSYNYNRGYAYGRDRDDYRHEDRDDRRESGRGHERDNDRGRDRRH